MQDGTGLTVSRAGGDNRSMRWLVAAIVLALALTTPLALPAQHAPKAEENERPAYVPPAPSKSVEIGNFYFRRKKYQGALSRYQEAATNDPYYAPAYLGLGRVYDKLGFRKKALAAYQKYLDLLPSDKDAEEAKEVHRAIARLQQSLGHKAGDSPQRAAGQKGAD
jgi:tetratricopeptide (TPR) repeat protein